MLSIVVYSYVEIGLMRESKRGSGNEKIASYMRYSDTMMVLSFEEFKTICGKFNIQGECLRYKHSGKITKCIKSKCRIYRKYRIKIGE